MAKNENENPSTSYNQDIQRINDIIQKLSSPDCDIDKMLDYVKEASVLLQRCNEKLSKTGMEVQEALEALNKTMSQTPESDSEDSPF